MLPVRGAASVIDKTPDEILALIDTGELLWVFDISLEPERARKREIRILPEAIADFADGRKSSLTWAQVFGLLVPHGEPVLGGAEIECCLNCSDLHLSKLAERKLLNRCERGRPVPGGDAKYTRNSLEKFLADRRVI